jgi:hypothetical protein
MTPAQPQRGIVISIPHGKNLERYNSVIGEEEEEECGKR